MDLDSFDGAFLSAGERSQNKKRCQQRSCKNRSDHSFFLEKEFDDARAIVKQAL